MKTILLVTSTLALVLGALLLPPRPSAAASTSSPTDDVIRLEARWITAILDGDKTTVAAILSPDFKHIVDGGKVLDRAQELASITKEPFVMALSEQTVDFDSTGDAAVLHGLDTITEPGKPTWHKRFTDVFFEENGKWMAVSAQENLVAP